ncbi:hypothetical protein [Empedobacter falsenii]|uniref:Cell wall anchor protein n=1 Tax=Empedobacter falsenii TaxID=343874 RepID=A0AAW7DGI1_9FLAO|nr:hypothetical protein [Empedobacter falsenii]MDM1550655.1 hypothetical protein [Empedobacter falsenii]
MNEILITGIFSLVTGVGGWFVARRKNLAETQASELDVVEKSVKYYREMVDDLGKRLKDATNELADATEKHRLAIDELTEAKNELKSVKTKLKSLEKKFEDLAQENRYLVTELKKYKQLRVN